jgi:hypothetical protein
VGRPHVIARSAATKQSPAGPASTARQAGDCFVAALLTINNSSWPGLTRPSTHRRSGLAATTPDQRRKMAGSSPAMKRRVDAATFRPLASRPPSRWSTRNDILRLRASLIPGASGYLSAPIWPRPKGGRPSHSGRDRGLPPGAQGFRNDGLTLLRASFSRTNSSRDERFRVSGGCGTSVLLAPAGTAATLRLRATAQVQL